MAASGSDDVFAMKLKALEEKKKQIEATFPEQTTLLHDITEKNTLFQQSRQADPVTRQGEQALMDLQRAVDMYEQLLSQATEGGIFYSELCQKLLQLEQTVQDHCAARELEKRELELNFGMARHSLQHVKKEGEHQVATDAAYAASLAGSVPQTLYGHGAAPPPPAYGNHHPANPYPYPSQNPSYSSQTSYAPQPPYAGASGYTQPLMHGQPPPYPGANYPPQYYPPPNTTTNHAHPYNPHAPPYDNGNNHHNPNSYV